LVERARDHGAARLTDGDILREIRAGHDMRGVTAVALLLLCQHVHGFSLFSNVVRHRGAPTMEARATMTIKSGATFMFRATRTVFAVLACVLVAQNAKAQSTIFNIPSTDTVEKGKGYFEIDFLPQAPGPDGGSSTIIYNPRGIVGLPHDTEIGVNVPIYHIPGSTPSNFGYIQPNIKTKVYKNDDAGMAASVGVVANFALNSTDTQLPWAYVYGNFSKKAKGDYGPRVTIGGFGVIAKQDDPVKVGFVGTRGGVLLGYEQPLAKTVSFVADWFSGKNSIGYFTPGVSITLPHSGLLNIGYSFGNDSWENSNATKNRYVFVYYGVTF
jgi:hypothetical protein